jgi:hypothetical protein
MEVCEQLHAPVAVPLWKEFPVMDWKGGFVGPRAGLDAMASRKMSLPLQEIKSGLSKPEPSHYTDRAAATSVLKN